jgi:superfamily II DNA or RNA helicase
LSDDLDLCALVGKPSATTTVAGFLKIRPSGGRVFVDADGHAATPVDNRLIYLGHIGTGVAPLTVVPDLPDAGAGSTLLAAVMAALVAAPGSTARELVYELRRSGRAGVTKSEVNSLLYRGGDTFAHDSATAKRWRVAAGGSAGPHAQPRAPQVRTRRPDPAVTRATDAYVSLVAAAPDAETSAPSPRPRLATADPRPVPPMVLDLMVWQREAVQRWYDRGCRGIIEAVTGTGKTHLGLEAVAQAARDGETSTVLVPSVDLQDQWVARFETFLPHLRIARVGGRKSGDPSTADVTIAIVNSALRQDLSSLSGDSLLVADEVHRYGSEQFQYALRANYRRRLGLTATLERGGDDAVEEVLSPYFGGSIMTVAFDRAIREGVVAPFRLVMAPVSLNDEERVEYDKLSRQISNAMKVLRSRGALKGGGGSVPLQLGRLRGVGGDIGRAARVAESGMRERRQFLASASGKLDAIEELSELVGESEGTVIFTQSRDVAESAAQVLREWGVPASALHSDMGVAERRETLLGLDTGRLRAVAAPKLLDEGIDVRSVDLGIVMTASTSRRQMVQRLGRVIRRKDDGRAVTFVILFAQDTVEDPGGGAHEGFFDLVGDVASTRIDLEPGWTANDLSLR